LSTTCVSNNSVTNVSGVAGFNTETCSCNNGYVQTMNNANGTLSINCTCVAANGLATLIANSLTYCCPANATISNATCGCESNTANKFYRYNDTKSSLWMCVTANTCTSGNG